MMANQQFPMTWEQAVEWLRRQPDQGALVKACYFDDPLLDAAKRFHESEEWAETRKRLPAPPGKALDLGAGRGISSYALAMDGFDVTALEPDPSPLVGAGAIQSLTKDSELSIAVVQGWGEHLSFDDDSFDVVHGRQVLHHAHSLPDLCKEAARVLKPGGIFIATREHVVDKPEEIPAFLESLSLYHLSGGENAFPLPQYINAIEIAGLHFREILTPFDSAINYFPQSTEELTEHMRMLWRWLYAPSPEELVSNARQVVCAPGRFFTFVAQAPNPAIQEEVGSKFQHAVTVQRALYDALLAALNEVYRRIDVADVKLTEQQTQLTEQQAQFIEQLEQLNTLRWNLRHPYRWFFRKICSKICKADV